MTPVLLERKSWLQLLARRWRCWTINWAHPKTPCFASAPRWNFWGKYEGVCLFFSPLLSQHFKVKKCIFRTPLQQQLVSELQSTRSGRQHKLLWVRRVHLVSPNVLAPLPPEDRWLETGVRPRRRRRPREENGNKLSRRRASNKPNLNNLGGMSYTCTVNHFLTGC